VKKRRIIAFTRAGANLAARLAAKLDAEAWSPSQYAFEGIKSLDCSLHEWTRHCFGDSEALIFLSACGIAVRAVAPCLGDKTSDPAVVVLDDLGRNVISLLSGHLGGANKLAELIASHTGGRAVITTATDVHGLLAADAWAAEHNCAVQNIAAAKAVSAAILEGERIGVAVTEQLQPAPWPITLWLRPRNLVLGVGCKKGADFTEMKKALEDFLEGAGVSPLSLSAVASIDLKAGESAILRLAAEFGVPFRTYGAEELKRVPGRFSASERVLSVTGVDNVCERAAVLCACGPLLRGKTVYKGVTFALARRGRTGS
jgi:cobalt-precorrin 5A hydrolase